MSADQSAAITAVATAVLAIAAIGAFVYAVRTYCAQAAQLVVAKDEAKRLRAPVFEGAITPSSADQASPFYASIRLRSNEPVASVRLVLEGVTAAECPVGFFPGVDGVPPIDRETQPTGWRNEAVRPDASWGPLSPNAHAVWRVDAREAAHDLYAPDVVHGRADCEGLAGERWTVPVTLAVDTEVINAMRPPPTVHMI